MCGTQARSILRGRLPTLLHCSVIGSLLLPDFAWRTIETLQLQHPTEHPMLPVLHSKR